MQLVDGADWPEWWRGFGEAEKDGLFILSCQDESDASERREAFAGLR